jgi:predicted ATPase
MHGLAAQLLRLAHRQQTPTLFLLAHTAVGIASVFLGEPVVAREHLEQGIALYDPQKHNARVSGVAQDPGVACLSYAAWALWFLGYPDQALRKAQEALTLAQELDHPYSVAFAMGMAARVYQWCRDEQRTHEQAEATVTLCTDQGFQYFLAIGTILRGWALAEQGQGQEGIAQIRQGMVSVRATGAEILMTYYPALLAEAQGRGGQAGEGLAVLGEALAIADKNEERFYNTELYRLKGELTLKAKAQGSKSTVEEAEECFWKAVEIARRQSAKSLELRAVMSLARLWQQQGKKNEAHQMLSKLYGWFTEGFDTKDLQDAKRLIEELAQESVI